MSDRFGLGSSHYAWSAGMESSFLDPLLVKPHTSWRGTRGVRVAFGGVEEEADEVLEDEDLSSYGADDDLDALFDDLDSDLDQDLGFGRLYLGAEYHELDPAEPADIGALLARSGGSGYRGGRPSFGAQVSVGPVRYEGSDLGAFFLGAAGLLLLGKGMGAF